MIQNATIRRLSTSLLSFGGIQAAQIFLPLLALPYLSRTLGADAFGRIMYWNVVPLIIGYVLDWGFLLGGVREVAAHRHDPVELAKVWSIGLTAKCLLAGLTVGMAWLLTPLVPHAEAAPKAFLWAVCCGLARGFNPLWFFQGLGDGSVRRLALLDIGSSMLILALMFFLVRQPADGERYLMLFAMCKGSAYAVLCLGLSRHYFLWTWPANALRFLWRTRIFFVSGLAGQLYTSIAYLALGGILSAKDMGFFLSVDKIIRALVSLSNPITQTLFPEVCALHHNPTRRLQVQRWTLILGATLSLGAAMLLLWLAPHIMRIALGPEYQDAAWVLRTLAIVVPLLTCNTILGPQMLIPIGKERILMLAQLAAGIICMPCALLLAWAFQLSGAVFLPILAEGCIFICMLAGVARYMPELFALRAQPPV